MRWENSLPDQLLGLWVLAVVGASPNMGAPWAQEGKYPYWAQGTALTLEASAVRSRGVTQKQFRIIWNGFRATCCRSWPHHLYHRSVPLPRLWHLGLHGYALSVIHPSCLLIARAAPWCVSLCRVNLGPAPWPFAIFCPPTLSRAGPGAAHVPPAFSRWSAFT